MQNLCNLPNLPENIVLQITQQLPKIHQVTLDKWNKDYFEYKYQWEKECCLEPTITEISNWIYEQSYILKTQGITDFFAKYAQNFKLTLTFNLDTYIDIYYTGYIQCRKPPYTKRLKSLSSIKRCLQEHNVNLVLSPLQHRLQNTSILNFMVVRNILSKRIKCLEHGVNMNSCFQQILTKYLEPRIVEHLMNI